LSGQGGGEGGFWAAAIVVSRGVRAAGRSDFMVFMFIVIELVTWTHSMLAILAFVTGLLVALWGTLHLLRRRRFNNLRYDVLPLHFSFTPRVKFAFHEVGKKDDPLVLVIHGFPDCAASFCAILPPIAAQGSHSLVNAVIFA
jgi:hypothetical protein